jgi:hypothetical protein
MEDEGLELLTSMFFEREWFCEAGKDDIGRYVVYVKRMNMETMTSIPDMMLGKQVLVHFIGSKTARREDFTTNGNHVPFARVEYNPLPKLAPVSDGIEELSSDLLENDIGELIDELSRLEKICGSNILADVFFEVHDGKNAVTNLSDRYPTVRDAVVKLYDEYGFDVIYEELEM